MSILRIFTSGLVFLFLAGSLHAQTPSSRITPPFLSVLLQTDFESETLPDTLTLNEGWRIVDQRGDHRLCISNYRSQFGLFSSFLFGRADWENYSIEVEVQLTARDVGHMAILTRQDADLWGYRHRLFFDEWGKGFAQYYYGGLDGTESQVLGEFDLPIESGKWYILRAEVQGKVVRTVVNGWAVAHYNVDKNVRGSAGIEVGPGARLCVDDLVVRSLDRSPLALAGSPQGTANRNANIRLRGGFVFDRVGVLRENDTVFILGWNEDRTWVHIRKEKSFVQGWVWAEYIDEIIPPTPPAPVQ